MRLRSDRYLDYLVIPVYSSEYEWPAEIQKIADRLGVSADLIGKQENANMIRRIHRRGYKRAAVEEIVSVVEISATESVAEFTWGETIRVPLAFDGFLDYIDRFVMEPFIENEPEPKPKRGRPKKIQQNTKK